MSYSSEAAPVDEVEITTMLFRLGYTENCYYYTFFDGMRLLYININKLPLPLWAEEYFRMYIAPKCDGIAFFADGADLVERDNTSLEDWLKYPLD